jgi:transposase
MRRARTSQELGFDHHDRRRLTRALERTSELRVFRRIQAVLLVALGWALAEAAQVTGAGTWAVYDWVRRYLRDHLVASLEDAPRSGRPRAAARVTDARIVREFRRDPLRLGYNTTGWTVPLLATHLSQKYGCRLSPATLRRRMRHLGLRWKRPRYVYADKDPHRAQKKGGSSAA